MSAKSVLFVKDSSQWAATLAKLLATQGYNLETIEDGPEAVSKIISGDYDVVVLDILLARINTERLITTIRRYDKVYHSRLIIISAWPEIITTSLLGCMDAVVAKSTVEDTASQVNIAIVAFEGEGKLPLEERIFFDETAWSPRSVNRNIEVYKRKINWLYEVLGQVLFEVDEEFKIINLNDSAIKLFGKKTLEIIGKPFSVVFSLDDKERLSMALDRIKTKELEIIQGIPYEHKGVIYECSIYKLPVFSAAENYLLKMEDITATVHAKRELLRSQMELEQLFHSAAGAACVTDLNGRVSKANENFFQLTELTSSQVVGKHCSEVFSGEQCDTDQCSLTKTLRGDPLRDMEITRTNALGKPIVCLLSTYPLYLPDGKLSGILKDYRDITEHKRLEAVAKASSISASMGQVFSSIRHELVNPLNSCKMTLSVLLGNLRDFDKDGIEEYLQRSLEEVKRIEFILRSLRRFALHEVISPKKRDLEVFLTDIGGIFAEECSRRVVSFSLDIGNDPLWCVFDNSALRQVFRDIFENALEAVEGCQGAEIVVRAKQSGQEIIISLEDNGVGISEEVAKNLFSPFVTNKEDKHGLGLAVSRKVLAAMRGTISLEKRKPNGAKVLISLPID